MDKDILKGLKQGFGIFVSLCFLFGLVFAVGFHQVSDILPGKFIGNYQFQDNVTINGTLHSDNIQADIAKVIEVASQSNDNSIIYLTNGIYDSFNNQDGVSYTTASFDSSSKYYTNKVSTTTLSTSSEWNPSTGSGSSTYSGDDVANSADGSMTTVDSFTGDVFFQWTIGPGTSDSYYGFVPSIDSWNRAANNDFSPKTNTVWINANNPSGAPDAYKGSGTVQADIFSKHSSGTKIKFERENGVFKIYTDNTLKYTWAYTSTASMYFAIADNTDFDNFNWTETSSPTSSTLCSVNYTSDITPSKALVRLTYEEIDPIVLNTDLILNISSDGGTNWDEMSLTQDNNITSTKSVAVGTNIFSMSGNKIQYKILTSSQEIKLHGIGITWS